MLAAWQILGLISVISDWPWLYKLYSRINFLATIVLLCFTIAFTVTAAAKHNDAVNECMDKFEGPLAQDAMGVQAIQSRLDQGRHDLCNYLSWADVGLMGGLVVVVGLTQLYMCYMQGQYGKRQRAAQKESLSQPDAAAYPMRNASMWNEANRYKPVMTHENITRNEPLYNTYSQTH